MNKYFLKDFTYLSDREHAHAQAGGAAGKGKSRLPAEKGA